MDTEQSVNKNSVKGVGPNPVILWGPSNVSITNNGDGHVKFPSD